MQALLPAPGSPVESGLSLRGASREKLEKFHRVQDWPLQLTMPPLIGQQGPVKVTSGKGKAEGRINF